MSETCVFCAIIRGEHPASIVYADAGVVAFLDTTPVNPGHTLVVPRRHVAALSELEPAEGAQVFVVAQRLAAALRASGLRCEGINLRVNDGVAAGQRVFHVHLHVMPRFVGDVLGLRPLDFGPRPSREDLEAIATQIKLALPAEADAS